MRPPIFLYTDFGSSDLYVGQLKAVLHQYAPEATPIDLLHDATPFDIPASAHLLAALAQRIPPGAVTLAVVDPGVGGPRRPVAVRADERWYVGPDNGLLSVLSARAARVETYAIVWEPVALSASFHGRDLFAPVAGMLAISRLPAEALQQVNGLDVELGAADIAQVIHIDHYGNVLTGLRARFLSHARTIRAGGHELRHARVFSEVQPGTAFWYENSLGLVELAANRGDAARLLNVRVGSEVLLI